MMHSNGGARCTCGGEDSDGRMDVLRCPVHGHGEVTFTICGKVPWDEMSQESQDATNAEVKAWARIVEEAKQ